MERHEVLTLLRNLAQRIERNPATGKLKLEGVVSDQELEALQAAAALLSPEDRTDTSRRPRTNAAVRKDVQVDDSFLRIETPEIDDAVVCLDFGTAMSKAFAISKGEPAGLSLGAQAGYSESEFAVPSSIYVSNSGHLFFGHEAVHKSDEEAADRSNPRARLDSPKQQLSLGDLGDLRQCVPDSAINPTDVKLSYWDFITLYLAYLSDLVGSQLVERGLPRYVRRRVARPCWDAYRAAWADEALTGMCVSAQVLADTFRGAWSSGSIDVHSARSALDRVRELIDTCKAAEWLRGTSVPEPVAAGFGRVFRGRPERRGFLVVDVGAGTTDYGLFVLSQLEESAPPAVVMAKGSVSSLRQAGDRVDGILRKILLHRHDVDPKAGEEGHLISLDLNRNIRRWKETLYRDGTLSYRLSNDIAGQITLKDFESTDEVNRFVESLEGELSRLLSAIDPSWVTNLLSRQPVQVVLTGGASQMPLLRRLTEGTASAHGCSMQLVAAPDLPQWIESEYPEYSGAYRQLAVAIGGAAPDLPKRLKEFEIFGGGGPRGPVEIERFQTRGA